MSNQENLIETKSHHRLDSFSKEALIQRCVVIEGELTRVVQENYRLRNQNITDFQLQFILQEEIETLRNTIFGTRSERYKKPERDDGDDGSKKDPRPRVKKPSERYPNIPVREHFVTVDPAPVCPCCNKMMIDSGMTEDSEQLTVIPKKFEIIKIKKAKFRCDCQGSVLTAPTPQRVIPGSSYSDEMVLDIALSKYCDLIPIGRYKTMAERSGLIDLPANSLIETTHYLADFVSPVYSLIKEGALSSRVLNADETPHRMLEGDDKKSWYLWGFSTPYYSYLECRDTRSGDVASDMLTHKKSKCEILVTDVFSGYGKAVRLSNIVRAELSLPLIRSSYCNAHSRRYFFKAFPQYPEAKFYLDHYHEIYQLNSKSKGQSLPIVLGLRAQTEPRFKAMKERALEELAGHSSKGKYAKALKYFINNYEGLTLFLTDPEIPIDNNSQERSLRSHVVGRKTWYGTHSKRGALTAAILFSIIETCKLNHVNPREYFKYLVEDMLAGAKPYTPLEFKKSH